MQPVPGFGLKWLKALMLSPGVLFTLAYLALWSATNLYLDHTFRAKLGRAFSSVAGNRYQLTIGSLETSPDLSTLTLEGLELVAVGSGSPQQPRRIRLDQLDISCPDIGLFMVRPSSAEAATMQVSKTLLLRCEEGVTSMDKKARPAPAYRGDLAYRVGEQGHVRIP
ncbi:MAG: hypothetical protein HGB04_05070 [Chlorobiaceae bacterium]|nr:hypothetical protein [Chlorobiaceae bacterium]